MIGLFSTLSNVFKSSKRSDKVNIDNACAKLNYRVTTTVLIVCTIVVCAQQYIGDIINCLAESKLPQNVIDSYCFYFGTHTHKELLPDLPFEHRIGPIGTNTPLRVNSYYQWVPFYLFFLSITFYAGHSCWKQMEGGVLRKMLTSCHLYVFSCTDIKVGEIPTKEDKRGKVKELADYIFARCEHGLNFKWSMLLIFFEFFNFVQNVFACWLTDKFLGGKGDFWKMYKLNDTNVLFPTVSKCTFHLYGASGGLQNRDALCLLNMNYVNGIVFFYLHFWLPLVASFSLLAILWRLVTLCTFRSLAFNNILNLRLHDHGSQALVDRQIVLSKISYCDWIFLNYVGGNINPIMFQEILTNMAECYKKQSESTTSLKSSATHSSTNDNISTSSPTAETLISFNETIATAPPSTGTFAKFDDGIDLDNFQNPNYPHYPKLDSYVQPKSKNKIGSKGLKRFGGSFANVNLLKNDHLSQSHRNVRL